MIPLNRNSLWRPAVLTGLLWSSGFSRPVSAGSIKAEKTPCFWQQDPHANFSGQGRDYCAPSSIADGLVYLTMSRGLDGLVASTDYRGEAALIKELATGMNTDAAGTNANDIVTGLLNYAKRRGYALSNLQVASWASLSESNKKYRVSIKPQLHWMAAATKDPDVVQVFGFGWYKKEKDGRYTRHSGHWVNVVGSGPLPWQFDLHNPALEPKRQKTDTLINLKLVEKNFLFPGPKGWVWNMTGYYQAEGPGLPFNKNSISAAVLESVIAFKIKKA